MKKKGVVYTCITGGYDDLKDHDFINQDWDYICFTDDCSNDKNGNLKWQVRGFCFDELDDVRNQRWHKLHPHILFPEYQKSIYIDANINILDSRVFDAVDKIIQEEKSIAIRVHPERDCLYDELIACIELGKDNEAIMRSQVELIRADGFPEKSGLFEANIIYRDHHDKLVKTLMEDWWWWIKNYSRRDQLSLTYVAWKNNATIEPLLHRRDRNNPGFILVESVRHTTKEELLLQREELVKRIYEQDILIRSLNQKIDSMLNFSSRRIIKPVQGIIKSVIKQARKIRNYLFKST
jgi:hypothetical protein